MASSIAHRKRCRRYNAPGHAHFLTFSCFRRQPFLSRDASCQWLTESIGRAIERYQFHLWAYVFMPEHVHLLLWPTRSSYQISQLLKAIKQPVAMRAVRYLRRHHPSFLEHLVDRQPNGQQCYRFWQRRGGFDRNLTEPVEIWQTIDYIHNNPVERGLCKKPEEWLWGSAVWHIDGRSGLLTIHTDSLPSRVEFVNRSGLLNLT